jgi:NADPH-dependent 2,4-dienoyl-CoA reductase/sulfur reductase-like enzyme
LSLSWASLFKSCLLSSVKFPVKLKKYFLACVKLGLTNLAYRIKELFVFDPLVHKLMDYGFNLPYLILETYKEHRMAAKVNGSVLVVGAGIAGMQSALDLADSGFYVHLVERSPAIGGVMAQLDKTFPTNDCSM